VVDAVAAKAEGVGLFRTEFCFLNRETAPTVEEQVEAYRPVFAAFPGRKVVVRTLDAGADKPLAFVTDAAEENPALGIRGYRTSWRRPELLDDQLAAIAMAAGKESADAWVMAPMIATVDETADFVARCRAHGLQVGGVMIETPAAALMAAEISAECDFLSLGTNDLAQYTMAADRLVGDLAPLNDPWQPAVLRLISTTAVAGTATSTPVGVCGEAAADPLLAAVLVGLGVTSLSMSPKSIPAVAALLSTVTLEQCRAAGTAATGAATSAEARAAVGAILA
jgi:phosphoenolpyruvate-protein kinase (PTS system EI component)